MEDLRAGVLEALIAGKTEDEIIASNLLSGYSGWISYGQWRALNIQGMARFLRDTGQAG